MWRTLFVLTLGLAVACGNDADRLGVGAQCSEAGDCEEYDVEGDDITLVCLTQFDGGYCGVVDCESNDDCPDGSGCVAHTDLNNYCFRICEDKPECNANRDPENEANCSSNITWVDEDMTGKACVPPSSGL